MTMTSDHHAYGAVSQAYAGADEAADTQEQASWGQTAMAVAGTTAAIVVVAFIAVLMGLA